VFAAPGECTVSSEVPQPTLEIQDENFVCSIAGGDPTNLYVVSWDQNDNEASADQTLEDGASSASIPTSAVDLTNGPVSTVVFTL